MFKAVLTLLALLFAVTIFVGGIIGYLRNIIKLFYCDLSTIEGIEIVRIIGIALFPIGAIFGWC